MVFGSAEASEWLGSEVRMTSSKRYVEEDAQGALRVGSLERFFRLGRHRLSSKAAYCGNQSAALSRFDVGGSVRSYRVLPGQSGGGRSILGAARTALGSGASARRASLGQAHANRLKNQIELTQSRKAARKSRKQIN